MTRPLAAAAIAFASLGCLQTQYTPPPCSRPDLTGCIVEGVGVTGAKQLDEAEIKGKIATAESDHPLNGWVQRVPILSLWDRLGVEYERLDPFVLERDLARVERVYRAHGFYDAHARAARVTKDGRGRVHVEIVVDEGVPVVVKDVKLDLKEEREPPNTPQWRVQQEKMRADAMRAMEVVVVGAPLDEDKFEGVKAKLQKAMTTHGFAYGKVDAKADVDLVTHRAVVTYTATTGPPTKFGKISLDLPAEMRKEEERLRHIMALEEGARYSTGYLDYAQGALSELRVFGSVDVVPQLEPMGQPDASGVVPVPVTFRLTPTPLKTVKMGGGVEVGTRVDVHGVAGWENRNLFGGLRTFTIEARPGLVFFPYTLSSLFAGTSEANFAVVPEIRVHTALAQPGFVELFKGSISADFNVYQLQPTATLGYLEGSTKAGLDRAWRFPAGRAGGGGVQLSIVGNVQVDQPLKLQIPGLSLEPCAGGYNFLVLPYAQASATLDLRQGYDGKRDPINPHSGLYLSNDVQVAAGPTASSSQDVKVRADVRGYVPLSKLTLALRVTGGVLHPFGGDLTKDPYPASVVYSPKLAPLDLNQPNQCKILQSFVPKGDVLRGSYIQLLQLRGFQSGGPNSNRGYAYSGIGPQEQVGGISPLGANNSVLPIATGGKALWEASVELRFPDIKNKIGTTLFIDASDVRNNLADFAANFAPHLSTGLGLRYMTPVGPLRVDVAVRVPGAQVIGSGPACQAFDPTASPAAGQIWRPGKPAAMGPCYLDPQFGQAGSLGGAPILISLGIGEAF